MESEPLLEPTHSDGMSGAGTIARVNLNRGGCVVLTSSCLSVTPCEHDSVPRGGQLPLTDIAGVSVDTASGMLTVAYAPYEPSDHNVAKKSPIGDTSGCERHRVLRPIELDVLAGEPEIAPFILAVRTALRAGADATPAAVTVAVSDQPDSRPREPLLVLLNPASGSGASSALYEGFVAPLFAAAGVATEVVRTTHAGHASSVVAAADLRLYSGIVVVSGDGLVSEVTNGLMSRADWCAPPRCLIERADAIKTPLGHVPGGSGNGLATSILRSCGEEYGVVEAGFVIARGATQPLDLATCEGTGVSASVPNPFYSLLSLSWGIVADIDIESETYRCCGPSRFDISTAQRIVCLRRYTGTLSYLPADAIGDEGATPGAIATSIAAEAESAEVASPQQLKCLLPGSIADPVPSAWNVETGETILFWACNTAWASFESPQTPNARLSDGCWQLLTITGDNPPLSFCEVLNVAEDPAALANQHPNIRCIPVRAFRIEPDRRRGCLALPCLGGPDVGHVSIDGEDAAYGAWQVEVHQGLARVIGA